MNELERIVREVAQLEQAGATFLLATVVRVTGSSYRRPGARMLVAGDRWLAGCVSGGCLEGDVLLRGEHRSRDGAVVVTYDSTSDDGEPWSVGLGCNGIVDVLLERVAPDAPNDAVAFARACFEIETRGTLVTILAAPDPTAIGTRLAVGPACPLARPVVDPDVHRALEVAARGPTGVIELPELGITALVETIAPSPQLFVLGSGHDAAPLVTLARSIGMRVTVADTAIRVGSRFVLTHRTLSTGGAFDCLGALIDAAAEAYVVIMHHHRDTDRRALAMALASRARYIGVLGPARRTHELLAELDRRPGDDDRLHAPIGLDVGAETPEQIALAIVAELAAVQHHRPGGMLRHRARTLHADIAIVVLAAGGSQRLGHPKQLVELAGRPLVHHMATTCLAAQAGPVAIVVGAHAGAVEQAVAGLPVAIVPNPDWREGIASSIRAAVRWAATTTAGALAIVLVDQPLLTVAHLTALDDAWLAGAPRAASRYAGTLGAPAVFDRACWDDLARLDGDQGAGRLLRGADVVAIDWPGGEVDVDTAEDERALQSLRGA